MIGSVEGGAAGRQWLAHPGATYLTAVTPRVEALNLSAHTRLSAGSDRYYPVKV